MRVCVYEEIGDVRKTFQSIISIVSFVLRFFSFSFSFCYCNIAVSSLVFLFFVFCLFFLCSNGLMCFVYGKLYMMDGWMGGMKLERSGVEWID